MKDLTNNLMIGTIIYSMITFGLTGITLYQSEKNKKRFDYLHKIENRITETIAYEFADKDGNTNLDNKELYDLGIGMGLITNGQKISRTNLIDKVLDAPTEKFEFYITNYLTHKKN